MISTGFLRLFGFADSEPWRAIDRFDAALAQQAHEQFLGAVGAAQAEVKSRSSAATPSIGCSRFEIVRGNTSRRARPAQT